MFALDERANPYFDENQMMDKFLKLIGPNGSSIGDTHTVWSDIKNDLELQAYTYDSKFWASSPGLPIAQTRTAPAFRCSGG